MVNSSLRWFAWILEVSNDGHRDDDDGYGDDDGYVDGDGVDDGSRYG